MFVLQHLRPFMLSMACLFSMSAFAGNERITLLYHKDCCQYEQAIEGLSKQLQQKMQRINLSEHSLPEIRQLLVQQRTQVLIAIGSVAADFASRYLATYPLLYSMVLNPSKILLTNKQAMGVVLNASPERQLNALQDLQLNPQRIGTICSSEGGCQWALQALQKGAQARGIKVSVLRRSSLAGLMQDLPDFMEQQDAMILLPDRSILNVQTFRFIARYSRAHRIPLIAPNGLFVRLGALMAYDSKPYALGVQTARLLQDPGKHSGPVYPSQQHLSMNRTTMKWIRVHMPRYMQQTASFYE